MTDPAAQPPVSLRAYVGAYLVALVAVWSVSVATWTLRDGATPALHPIAQGLQYLLVVVAAMIAALYLRRRVRELDQAIIGYGDRRWVISDDVGARTLWPSAFIGACAMLVNVALLVLADLAVGDGRSAPMYLAWVGAAIGSGLLLGTFGALLTAIVVNLRRLVRR